MKKYRHDGAAVGRLPARHLKSRRERTRVCGIELMEPRMLLSVQPFFVGAVYIEEDLGSDEHGDTFVVSFEGGAPGSRLERLEIIGDQNEPGFTVGDVIFDTVESEPGTNGPQATLGADHAIGFSIKQQQGIDRVEAQVDDGSSVLLLSFAGFDPGDRLVFTIDVDEVEDIAPNAATVEEANEGLDPITSGVEFQSSLLRATITAPHFNAARVESRFVNRYDPLIEQTPLHLPRDDEGNNRDRTAGSATSGVQEPLPIALSGHVYHDRNNDGQQQLGEEGIAGVLIQLQPVDTLLPVDPQVARTDVDGFYSFDLPIAGTYRLVEVQPPGYLDGLDRAGTVDGQQRGVAQAEGDTIDQISLAGGEVGQDYDFGELLPVSIEGQVHLSDAAGNCFAEESSQRPIAGARVELIDGRGLVVDQTVTDNEGRYRFADLPPGNYGVREWTPPGLIDGSSHVGTVDSVVVGQSTGDGAITQIVLASGQSGEHYDFCEHVPASLSGRVYHDRNLDGQRQSPEEGIATVTVQLVDQQGQIVATTRSDADGQYRFDNLRAGEYSVIEVQPGGWRDGTDRAGRVDGKVNGIAVNPGDRIDQVSIGWGEIGTDYDFGEWLPVTIRGNVHLSSVDGDCFSEDRDHRPVEGVRVELLDDVGRVVQETYTDATGAYLFTDLEPGRYGVREWTPEGLINGGSRAGKLLGSSVDQTIGLVVDADNVAQIDVASGDQVFDVDFCEHLSSSLAGTVYHDRTRDGNRQSPGEEGIADVLVTLLNAAGTVVAETRTDRGGNYRFDALSAGEYTIVETQPLPWRDGSDSPGRIDGVTVGIAANPGDRIGQITLGWGQRGLDYDFGEWLPISIEGNVHLSTVDGDCFSDEVTHPPLSGVVVQLLDETGDVLRTTLTDADGHYRFDDLLPGRYGVHELTPPGLINGGAHAGRGQGNDGDSLGQVVDPDTVLSIDVTSGDAVREVDFCEHVPARLNGSVYHDRNDNGLQESGEEGIAGALITLVDADSGGIVARAVTDGQGQYAFGQLTAGRYRLVESQPNGWLDGREHVGLIDGVPSGQVAENDVIADIRLGWGSNGQQYDFGELLPGSIRGLVHTDLNANCVLEANEEPLSGVEIELLDASGAVVATTFTDAAGRFAFVDLRPGVYTLHEAVQPAEFFSGGQRVGSGGGDGSSDNLISAIPIRSGEDLVDYAFCEEPPVDISGYVYQDGPPIELGPNEPVPEDVFALRDGQRTPDDVPLSGVTVELRHGVFGTAISPAAALPGSYPDVPSGGPLTVVTDTNGFYRFSGLRRGNYAVYERQPEGFLDGVDHSGTVPAIAVNRHERIEPQLLASLQEDPNYDAIIRIALFPGMVAEENNFSEVSVERQPLIVPFPNPEPAPVLQFSTATAARPIQQAPLDIPLLPHTLTVSDRIRPVSAFTWHLSVIDGGFLRGRGESAHAVGPVWIAHTGVHHVAWNDDDMSQMQWVFLIEGQTPQQTRFGMLEGRPIVGDFNGDGIDEVGVFRDGQWFIDLNGNGQWDAHDLWAKLGHQGDLPVVGDWDGDGKDDIGIFGQAWAGDPAAVRREPGLPDRESPPTDRPKNVPPRRDEYPGRRTLRRTAEAPARSDVIDHVFHFGAPGDYPVSGDWNGDGVSNIGVFFKGQWHLDRDGDGRFGDKDIEADFGDPHSIPVVGDFDGDGVDEIAIYSDGALIVDTNNNYRVDPSDQRIPVPKTHGQIVVGDFNGDGRDDVALAQPPGEPQPLRFVEVDPR